MISAASAVVLEKIFGTNYSFTDHSYDATYGARTYNTFDDYAKEAGRSRLLAGIHYSPSIAAGLTQGRQVGKRLYCYEQNNRPTYPQLIRYKTLILLMRS